MTQKIIIFAKQTALVVQWIGFWIPVPTIGVRVPTRVLFFFPCMKTPDIQDIEFRKSYSDKDFWKKVGKIAKKGGEQLAYLALLLFYVMKSDEVELKQKLMIAGALGYLILPVDLIPDFLPVAGYADDFAALMAAYGMIKASVTPEIKLQATAKCKEWFHDFDSGQADGSIDSFPDEQ